MMNTIFKRILLVLSVFVLFSCGTTKLTSEQKTTPAKVEKPATVTKVDKAAEEEYTRSTAGVSVSRAEFNADKNEILSIVESLAGIMAEYNYNGWLNYIEPASIEYWSSPKNLTAASKRLPIKVRLTSLNDYFRYVFVPSRKGRPIDEIRYLSRDSIKAIQVRGDTEYVYYNFVKVNGKWMVKLPQNQS